LKLNIFETKNRHKAQYKLAIKKAKSLQGSAISDDLHEALATKDSKCFWKTWKNKVCSHTQNRIRVLGNLSDNETVKEFATFFEQANAPNSVQFNVDKQKELLKGLDQYTGDPLYDKFNFSTELVAIALSKMESGKSAGIDFLTVEHLSYCHPVIFTILSKLFNAMLKNSYVPRDFGRGITIPIPKNESTRGAHAIDTFRGITLSPVISKLFEHCLLILFSEYFSTSMNQFGFKSKVGCPHAIYVVRKVVDYYVNNNSTVNLCFLDISKGFDKINHSVLLLKLMKRNVPKVLVKLLQYWYNISYNIIRWNNSFSEPYY